MTYRLKFWTEGDGFVGVIENGNSFDRYRIDASTAPEQFHMECQFIRERNPDMTDDQIGQHVLGRWYHRMEREQREASA